MKIKFTFLIILLTTAVLSAETIDLNFFVNPKFNEKAETINNFVDKNIKDSLNLKEFNIFAGQIFKDRYNPESFQQKIDSLNYDLCSPTDFNFSLEANDFLISNIQNEKFLNHKIIELENSTICIFSIYSPDFFVKNTIDSTLSVKYNVKKLIKNSIKKIKADNYIFLSNLSLYASKQVFDQPEIKNIISFDYQNKKNCVFNNKIFFTTFIKEGFYLNCRIDKNSNELTWNAIPLKK